MKTIYATPFTNSNKAATGPSTDSGFESVNQVVEMIGAPVATSKRTLVYGESEDRIIYSDFVVCNGVRAIDGPATTG